MKSLHKAVGMVAVIVAVGITGCQRNSTQDATPKSGASDQSAPSTPSAANSGATSTDQQASAGTSGPSATNDSAITAKVKDALNTAPELKATQISVDTMNGVVTLSGSIDTTQNLDRATQVAQTVDGVKGVKNQLSVKSQG
jgi:hyperosmotically inducible protein